MPVFSKTVAEFKLGVGDVQDTDECGNPSMTAGGGNHVHKK